MQKTRPIHPLVHELAVRPRAPNRTAGPATQIRVRIALHASGHGVIHATQQIHTIKESRRGG